jgi:hypothetical protein
MQVTNILLGRSPGVGREQAELAWWRAVRTVLQGVAAAFGTAGAGTMILTTDYWKTFGVACLGALITGLASFIHNIASFLPEDPTQTQP